MDRAKLALKTKILAVIENATIKANAFSQTENWNKIFGVRQRDVDVLRELLKRSNYEDDAFYDKGLHRYQTYANKASLIKEILQPYFEKKQLCQEGKELLNQMQLLENTLSTLG